MTPRSSNASPRQRGHQPADESGRQPHHSGDSGGPGHLDPDQSDHDHDLAPECNGGEPTPVTRRRAYDAPLARPCSWCGRSIPWVRKPRRPPLYCRDACRQRAYEHRHGFRHDRTVIALPGQARGQRMRATGYERGVVTLGSGKVHALRTSVHPDGRRRETVCGVHALAAPLGGHFSPADPRACQRCTSITARNPLELTIDPSLELSRLRAMIRDVVEERLDPSAAFAWLAGYAPESGAA